MIKILSKTILLALFMFSGLNAKSIEFNGIKYSVITSSTTKKEWLDKNLGATRVCQSKTDKECFGDYYQWGRKADGHEKANSKTMRKNIKQNKKGYFINIKSKGDFDWRDTKSDYLWKNSNSSNNVCPKGFRVPTIDELTAEVHNNKSFLKIPLSGYKSFCNGKLVKKTEQGALWSSSIYEDDAYYLDVRSNKIESSTSSRADAFSVRCIKE